MSRKHKRVVVYPVVCSACGYRVLGDQPYECPQCGHRVLVPEARRWAPRAQAETDVAGECFSCGRPAAWHPEADGRLMVGNLCRGAPEQPLGELHMQEAVRALDGIQRLAAVPISGVGA